MYTINNTRAKASIEINARFLFTECEKTSWFLLASKD